MMRFLLMIAVMMLIGCGASVDVGESVAFAYAGPRLGGQVKAPNALRSVSVTIRAFSTNAIYAFPTSEPDTEYAVIAQPVSFTGTPALGSFVVVSILKSKTSFTVIVREALGADQTLTFNCYVIRAP